MDPKNKNKFIVSKIDDALYLDDDINSKTPKKPKVRITIG